MGGTEGWIRHVRLATPVVIQNKKTINDQKEPSKKTINDQKETEHKDY